MDRSRGRPSFARSTAEQAGRTNGNLNGFLTLAFFVFSCSLGGAIGGLYLGSRLPAHHHTKESRDIVALGSGFVATMAALVIGLMVSAAKDSLDERRAELNQAAVDIIVADRMLSHYGPEADEARALLATMTERWIQQFWGGDDREASGLDPFVNGPPYVERAAVAVRGLVPTNDRQRQIQEAVLESLVDLERVRWLVYEQFGQPAVPMPFLLALSAWLGLIFASFGLFAPRNSTVISVLLICAVSGAAAILLIAEMEEPLTGLLQLPKTSLQRARDHLGLAP